MKTAFDISLSLSLFIFLLRHRGVRFSAKSLSNELHCSVRSVYRHIDILTIAGVPVQNSRGRLGGVWLEQSYKFD